MEAFVLGASGYTGLELLKLLSGHPAATVRAASSSAFAGERIRARVPEWPNDLVFLPHEPVMQAASMASRPAVAFLATPAEASAELAPRLLDRGVSVIDLSGAFRLERVGDYREWYGFDHPRPDLLARAEYGLVELFPPAGPRSAAAEPRAEPRLIANPGCYATASILAASPLVLSGLIEPGASIIIDGKSGATGAGRKLDESLLYSEVAESLRPYRVAKHQHTPEIERALTRLGGHAVRVTFTAHLVPMRRGLLVSVYARAKEGLDQAAVDGAFRSAYDGAPFIRVLEDRPPETGILTGSNFAEVGATLDARTRTICAFAAIDNLVKGAAGQAIQNLNLVLGVDPHLGLLPWIARDAGAEGGSRRDGPDGPPIGAPGGKASKG